MMHLGLEYCLSDVLSNSIVWKNGCLFLFIPVSFPATSFDDLVKLLPVFSNICIIFCYFLTGMGRPSKLVYILSLSLVLFPSVNVAFVHNSFLIQFSLSWLSNSSLNSINPSVFIMGIAGVEELFFFFQTFSGLLLKSICAFPVSVNKL